MIPSAPFSRSLGINSLTLSELTTISTENHSDWYREATVGAFRLGSMAIICSIFMDGLLSFHPDSIRDNPNIPPIVITDFKIFNKSAYSGKDSLLTIPITYAKEIELPYNQNFLSFEFAALDYTNPQKNQYKYRMIGLDKDIIYSGNRYYAEYTNLKPGKYEFWVTGSNNDGVWNKDGTSLKITILPPWWKTELAYSIYFCLFALAVYGIIKWRIYRISREKKILQAKVKERTIQIESQKQEIVAQKKVLEEKNKQILEIDRVKSRFFTNVSHEFRTPLSLILAPLEELKETKSPSGKEYKKLNMIQRNARRLLVLINQLLDISKIEDGNMRQKLVKGDVLKKIHAISSGFSSLAETRGINYIIQKPLKKKKTWHDPDKLEKILANLLCNAFKFTSEAGEIKLSAKYLSEGFNGSTDAIKFSVSDTGEGIPAEALDKIFDLFYQADETVKNVMGGTGVGLSLTRDLVSLLHGEIKVESQPGEETTFTVTLPLGIDHLDKSEYIFISNKSNLQKVSTEVLVEESQGMEKDIEIDQDPDLPLLLVVEDNRDIRELICEHLSGYRVTEAIDGSAGLKKAMKTIPDLIITDLMMPRMDGIELCKQLKNEIRTSHIPIIMLTAKADMEDKLEGLETGADDYIPKPFSTKELKVRVDNLIKQRKQLRERYSHEIKLQPRDVAITSMDEKFLERAMGIIEEHMSDENFCVNEFYQEMAMSRSNLYRKLYALTNQNPSEFIRTLRLKRAAKLLEQNFGNVTEVAYQVGFYHLSYFSKCFKEYYGVLPTKYTSRIIESAVETGHQME